MSKNNWTKTVTEINRKRYTIPDGWDTKEKIAADLQCSPDRVADLLKPGIQTGEIERQEFSVWDEKRRLTTRITCFRVGGGEPAAAGAAKPAAAVRSGAVGFEEVSRVKRALQKDPSRTNIVIAKNVRSTVPVVAALREKLGL